MRQRSKARRLRRQLLLLLPGSPAAEGEAQKAVALGGVEVVLEGAQLLLRQLGIAPAAPVVGGLVEVLGVGPAAVPHLLHVPAEEIERAVLVVGVVLRIVGGAGVGLAGEDAVVGVDVHDGAQNPEGEVVLPRLRVVEPEVVGPVIGRCRRLEADVAVTVKVHVLQDEPVVHIVLGQLYFLDVVRPVHKGARLPRGEGPDACPVPGDSQRADRAVVGFLAAVEPYLHGGRVRLVREEEPGAV